MDLNKSNSLEELLRETRQEAREDGIRQGKIVATTAALKMIMKNMKISPQEAMILLEIPRKERKTYEKILANRERQKSSKEHVHCIDK